MCGCALQLHACVCDLLCNCCMCANECVCMCVCMTAICNYKHVHMLPRLPAINHVQQQKGKAKLRNTNCPCKPLTCQSENGECVEAHHSSTHTKLMPSETSCLITSANLPLLQTHHICFTKYLCKHHACTPFHRLCLPELEVPMGSIF